jgi:ribose transport system substrate-binding protein
MDPECPVADAAPPADAGATDPCASSASQITALQRALDAQVKGLAISVASPTCIGPSIDKAAESGIKVVTFDSDAPDSKRLSYYGISNKDASMLAMKALAGFMGETGKVALVTSMIKDKTTGAYTPSASQSYVDRVAGFNEELAAHTGISAIGPFPCDGNNTTDDLCAKQVETILADNSDLGGLFFARGKILRETDLATKAPGFTAAIAAKRIHSVALDAPGDALANIEAGYAELVVAQKQFGWGYDVVALLFDVITAARQLPATYDSGWHVVCPNNVIAYEAMWTAMDFRSDLPKCQYLP